MEFAVVDIETTGGMPQTHGITEIAIVMHNGVEVTGKYVTLINPRQKIPPFIVNMTGISDEMVATAPLFEEVAPQIYNLLKDRIFVAHNVSFDYNFIKFHLELAGYQLNTPTICTIKSAKKIFPSHKKYSLGNICSALQIQLEDRHRATGDAIATTKLFELLLAHDYNDEIKKGLAIKN